MQPTFFQRYMQTITRRKKTYQESQVVCGDLPSPSAEEVGGGSRPHGLSLKATAQTGGPWGSVEAFE